MKIAYARVSSTEQNLDRQLDLLSGIDIDKTFTEKTSGGNITDREVWSGQVKVDSFFMRLF